MTQVHTSKTTANPSVVWAIVIALFFLLQATFWWPGILRPDSIAQLTQAELGNLSDHHPPAMAFLWGYLNLIYAGSGAMLVFHLLCFTGALFFFGRAVPNKWKGFFLVIPFFPPVMAYTGFVLKDIGFTFCFLLSIGILTFHTVHKIRLHPLTLAVLMLVLFYGGAVKYQAIFVLPIMALWIAYCLDHYRFFKGTAIKAALVFAAFLSVITLFNDVTTKTKDHSWQLVKLYDLAGISLIIGEDLIPEFNKKPTFSRALLKAQYNTTRVDELALAEDAILKKGEGADQRDLLWTQWFQSVKAHPGAYLTHRWHLMQTLITLSPVKSIHALKSHLDQIPSSLKTTMLFLEDLGVLKALQALTAFYPYVPFLLLYILTGFIAHRQRRSAYAFPLLMMNSAGLVLAASLFVFSMAAEARYIYLTICCFHLSHPFFFLTLKDMCINSRHSKVGSV